MYARGTTKSYVVRTMVGGGGLEWPFFIRPVLSRLSVRLPRRMDRFIVAFQTSGGLSRRGPSGGMNETSNHRHAMHCSRTSSRHERHHSSRGVARGSNLESDDKPQSLADIAKIASAHSRMGNELVRSKFASPLMTVRDRKARRSKEEPEGANGIGGHSVEDEDEDDDQLTPPPRCIIMPESNFRLAWDFGMLILILYNVFSVPITIAFEMDVPPDHPWFWFELLFDVMFLIDCFAINFNTVRRPSHPAAPPRHLAPYQPTRVAAARLRTRAARAHAPPHARTASHGRRSSGSPTDGWRMVLDGAYGRRSSPSPASATRAGSSRRPTSRAGSGSTSHRLCLSPRASSSPPSPPPTKSRGRAGGSSTPSSSSASLGSSSSCA